jgi:hypothetical protein
MDDRGKLAIKLDALQRLVMVNTLSGLLPAYIVTEHPKSGGTWVSQMLAECLGIPFPRNQRPPLRSCLLHGHMLYSPFLRNVVVVFRDGRDVMSSFYFHMLFQNERSSPVMVEKNRRNLVFSDYDDVRQNMAEFIQYVFDRESRSMSPFHFTWPRFVRSWCNREAVFVKYEDMVADAKGQLSKLLTGLTGDDSSRIHLQEIVDKYSFASQSNRKAGDENRSSFLRKGQPGDWKDKFSRKAAVLFEELAGQELRQLGYTRNADWVLEVE